MQRAPFSNIDILYNEAPFLYVPSSHDIAHNATVAMIEY